MLNLLMPISLLLFVLAITTNLHVISNGSLVVLSIGMFMIGLGEIVKYSSRTKGRHPGGVILDAVGAGFCGFGLIKIFIAAI